MGFCTDDEYWEFLRTVPRFEEMLMASGIHLVKYWFSVSDEEQEQRFQARLTDPTKTGKLSPMDIKSRERWVEYSKAKDLMFLHTDSESSPWWVVDADNKRLARLNTMAHLLSLVPYQPVDESGVELSPRPEVEYQVERPPIDSQHFVPDRYSVRS